MFDLWDDTLTLVSSCGLSLQHSTIRGFRLFEIIRLLDYFIGKEGLDLLHSALDALCSHLM